MNEYFPTVVQVIPLDNYHVQVFFDDGKIVDYDTTQDLKSSIFEPLRNIENFKNTCTVMNGTLAWDISGKMDESDCIDIDPFTLYELKAINSLQFIQCKWINIYTITFIHFSGNIPCKRSIHYRTCIFKIFNISQRLKN